METEIYFTTLFRNWCKIPRISLSRLWYRFMHGRRRLSPSGQQNAVPKDRANVSGIVLLRRTRHPHRYFRLLDPRKP